MYYKDKYYIIKRNSKKSNGKDGKRRKENGKKNGGPSLVPCVRDPSLVLSFSYFRTLSFTRSTKMAAPSLSLVYSARGAELCDATVVVT